MFLRETMLILTLEKYFFFRIVKFCYQHFVLVDSEIQEEKQCNFSTEGIHFRRSFLSHWILAKRFLPQFEIFFLFIFCFFSLGRKLTLNIQIYNYDYWAGCPWICYELSCHIELCQLNLTWRDAICSWIIQEQHLKNILERINEHVFCCVFREGTFLHSQVCAVL